MYAVCNTSLGKVAEWIGVLIKNDVNLPIIQVGVNRFKSLIDLSKKDRDAFYRACGELNAKYVINKTTATIHSKYCHVLKYTKRECLIGAYLVDPDAAGLKHCKICMRR
jgi:hypothetical protein